MQTAWLGRAAVVMLAACSFGESRVLVLDGPAKVSTDHLGPVEGPSALLSDGSVPEGVTWRVEPDRIATVQDGVVNALAPGEATVTAGWQGQEIQWTLVVDPRISLRLVRPPGQLEVGKRQPLHLEARMGEQIVDPGKVVWTSSAPEVLTVTEAGEVKAVAPGTSYVIATRGSSEAMAEIQVIEAP